MFVFKSSDYSTFGRYPIRFPEQLTKSHVAALTEDGASETESHEAFEALLKTDPDLKRRFDADVECVLEKMLADNPALLSDVIEEGIASVDVSQFKGDAPRSKRPDVFVSPDHVPSFTHRTPAKTGKRVVWPQLAEPL